MRTSRITRGVRCAAAAALLTALLTSGAAARSVGEAGGTREVPNHALKRKQMDGLPAQPGAFQTHAVANTTYLAEYQFNTGASCQAQGWTSVDLSAQLGDYVHVDDFAGLGGGSYGLLVPLNGGKSLWIGARADAGDLALCGYAALPGYGNSWNQALCSKCFTLTGNATLSYNVAWDSEPGYDYTYVELDAGCTDTWTALTGANTPYNGSGTGSESIVITAAEHGGSGRVRFNFISDTAWSDQDGLWDTDGAVIVDNLAIVDGAGSQTNQTFEAEAVGAHATLDSHWQSCNSQGFGDFAALLPGSQLLQEDPCRRDLSCVWSFFTGSTYDYSCGGFPGTTVVPFGDANGLYITNEVWSPLIPLVGSGSEFIFEFAAYRDLPLENLVLISKNIRSIVGGCPGPWLNDGYVEYGPDKDWATYRFDAGTWIDPAATHVQIAIGVIDYCPFYCGTPDYPPVTCHTPAPYIDSVKLKRVDTSGPQWDVLTLNMFQDNFASDGTVTGTVRADIAQDVLPLSNPGIIPGDSAAVTTLDPSDGIATDPLSGTGPAVYAYVHVAPPQAAKSGGALTQDPVRWPVVGSAVDPGGDTWYIVRFDTVRAQNNQTPIADNYCVDLNDNLFTPGDTIFYFFAATSNAANSTYFHGGLRALDNEGFIGAILTTSDINVAYANAAEFTCLPAAALNNGGDILYVDDGDGRGVQPFYDQAFQFLGILGKVDRYDVRGSDSVVGNGPGSRVTNIQQQILPYYKKILWNSAELDRGTIGAQSTDKSPDFGLLYAFVDQSTLGPGLYISGDGIAVDWSVQVTPDAVNLRSLYLNFNLVSTSARLLGLGLSPLVIGVPGGVFTGVAGPDTAIAYGGCPSPNKFDVLDPTGSAIAEMLYANNPAYAASISQTTVNGAGATARVILEGFSFDNIRDDRPGANGGVMDRIDHLYDVITFLENTVDQPTGAKPSAYQTSLSQNYPNPFNPSTTIEFTVRERSHVSLRVYNVAGQLVRTLVNDDRVPGTVHHVAWDGRNNAGQSVSSGVYFYKLVTSDMTQTKKMVLLK